MKVLTLLSLLVFTVLSSFGQNLPVFSEQKGELILLGKGDRSGLEVPPFDEWFVPEYDSYVPDSVVVKDLQGHISDVNILIVLGTWCSDSRREVPRFFKILDELKMDMSNIEVYFVDGDKTCPGLDGENYKIELVPTFIFFRNGEELGRIVETPNESLESDMYHIVK